MPSTLAMPSRTLTWPSLARLALWWQPSQPDQPAAPAPADQPAPTDQPAPADQPVPAEPAPAEPAPAPAPAPAAGPPAEAAPAPADEAPSDAEVIAGAEAALEGEGEVIVVTGSAIERTETTTPAPVTILDHEELQAAGMASIGDILQDLPSQSNGAFNTQANNDGDGSTRVNIRGLGERRTLVLVNGRRHVPGGIGADISVDLNSIPLAVIERVEVLKDGASAIYGSDAIGGVVNIITRSNFQGTEMNLYTGTTQGGGGTVVDASFVTGLNSAKGNVVFSAGYFNQADVFASERAFADPQRELDFASGQEEQSGSPTTPEGTIFDRVCNPGETPADGCAATQADLMCASSVCFRDPATGQWRDFRDTGNSDTGTGDYYNFQPDNYLLTPQRRYNVWSSGNYKFHENIRGFFEASYINRTSDQQLAPEPLTTAGEGILLSADSIYNPYGRAFDDVLKRMVETGPRTTSQDVDTFRIVSGIDGSLPDKLLAGWKYEVSYNYGRSIATTVNGGNLVRPNVAAALGPSYRDAEGNPQCGTPTNPGPEGCVPLDILGGVGSVTPEMVDWVTYTGVARGYNREHTVLGTLHGPLFKTPWDGDVVLALGGDYRFEAGGYQPDPLTAAGNTTGVKTDPTGGHYDVIEGFGELSVVPVTNRAWAKWLELNLAGRVVDYSTFGSDFSWKGGLLYKMPIGIAVRGTYSTAFRAPNVAELYGGAFDDFPPVTDPCSNSFGELSGNVAQNCVTDNLTTNGQPGIADPSLQLLARAGGDPNLEPETAKIMTSGVVYEPTFAEGLALTVDYFDIEIDNSIQRAGANIILSNCYASAPDQRTDCEKITRGPGNRIDEIDDRTTNIGGAETNGIDVAIHYLYQIKGAGQFRHDLEGTRLLSYNEFYDTAGGGEIKKEGLGVYDLGVYPKYRANFSTLWNRGGVGAGFNVRYIHSFRECRSADDSVRDDCSLEGALSHEVDPNVTADVLASYSFMNPAGRSTISAGVNNVLDQDPPNVYNGFLATSDYTAYDYLGRFFYLRLSQLF